MLGQFTSDCDEILLVYAFTPAPGSMTTAG